MPTSVRDNPDGLRPWAGGFREAEAFAGPHNALSPRAETPGD
ncbi:hypothetical protein ACFY8O_14570 [Streptomyces argenteolus]|uniref:Uncharacterized protein n=1 Tax=Streptomyces argenteolus TaxID=67274 RepID=A0ABW6X557_9ACTN